MTSNYGGYTQRDWERTVGWGKVPDEYSIETTINTPNGQNTQSSETSAQTVKATVKKTFSQT